MSGRASLNHVYRTVWNQALGVMVAVAEIASSGGRSGGAARDAHAKLTINDAVPPLRTMSLSILMALGAFAAHAQTLPSGGVAVHGGAAFNTSQPSRLTVTTTNGANSNHSAINWNSFSIGSGNTTNFVQPNAGSLSINRVVTNTPSQFFGTLSSNGKLVLVNQSGIAVGAGAVVDTAGFTASALGMSQADAIAGRLRFGGGSAGGVAGLTVDGNIIARGGDVVLIAPNVDVAKTAVVESQGGSVVLAAGQSVEVTGRGLEGITLQVQAPTDQAINLGTLKGDAVGIFAGSLRHSGMIQAVQANLEGGKVVLRAGGDAYVEGHGRINATSAAGKGGSVDVLGHRVAVMDDAVIDVSGASGGGSVRVGGDYQGRNAEVPNASFAYLGKNASVKADATGEGAGGRVIFWADDTMRAYGNISARGGALGGDGGFVEVSGHRSLDFQGHVNTLAPLGRAGTLLLDPSDLTIDNTVNSGGSTVGSIFTAGLANSILTWGTINTLLSSGGLEVRTNQLGTGGNGDIFVNAGATLTGTGFLNLIAHRNLVFAPGVAVSGTGDYTLVAGWNNTGLAVSPGIGNITFGAGSSLSTPGNLFFNAGNSVSQSASATITAHRLGIGNTNPQPLPGGVNLPGANLVDIFAVEMANPTASSGLTFNNAQNLTIDTAVFATGINATGNPNPIFVTSTGALTVSSPVSSGGNVSMTGSTGITLDANVTTSGTLNLNSSAGNGLIQQSGGAISAVGATTANAGLSDVLLGQPGNDFSSISAFGGQLTIRDANALNVTSYTLDPTGNLYFQAGGALVVPAGAITTTGQISLITDATLTTPGALSGSDIVLVGQTGLLIANNVTATGTLQLASTFATGSISQTTGTSVKATGLTSIFTNSFVPRPVNLGEPANDFSSLTVSGAGSFTVRDTNAIVLDNIGASTFNLSTGGAITQAAGAGLQTNVQTTISAGTNNVTLQTLGNNMTVLQVLNAGAVDVHNFVSPLTLFSSNAGSLKALTDFDIFVSGTGIAASSGNVELKTTGGLINAGSPITAQGAIKLEGATDLFVSSALQASAPGTAVVLATSGGNLDATGATLSTPAGGRWLTFLPSTTGNTYGVFNPVNNANFRQVNAPIGTAPLGTGNGSLFAVTPTITGTLTGSVTKVFDGSNTISLAGATLIPSGGYLFGETGGSFLAGATGTMANPNVGVGKAVAASNLPLSGVQLVSTLTTPTYGYVLTSASGNIATVTAAPVSAASTISLDGKRAYDGTPIVKADIFTLKGLVGSDTLTLSGSGFMADRDVGSKKPVSLGTLALGDGKGLASNYTFSGGNFVATITPANVSIAGLAASNKVYDGTTAVTVSTASAALVGIFAGDSVGLSGGTGAFSDKNAGVGKPVGISGLVLTGAQAENYNLVSSSAVAVADISKASISGVTGITAQNKVYDGTSAATLSTQAAQIVGIISGDSVSIRGATGQFSDKNVGQGKTVNVAGLSLSGNDAGNYNLANATTTALADITKAPVTAITGISANAKVYDASTAATLNTASAKAAGLISGDAVTVAASGQFADKNAGVSKTVNLTGIGLSGVDAGNYNFTGSAVATVSADIAKKPITSVSGITANDKVYDGNTSATLVGTGVALGGVLGGDVVSFGAGTGAFSDRHAGSNKTVNITGVLLGGADAGNYTVAGDVKAASANITPRPQSTWTGAGGNTLWSNSANWDALPDRNNVLAVSIPGTAGQVTFDAAVDPTILQSLTSGQTLVMTGSSLGLTSDLNLPSLSQTGGTLRGAGSLNVASSFNQTGGSLQFARDVTINQTSGNLVVGDVLARRVELKAPVGGISQSAGLDTPTLVAEAATGMALTHGANNIGSVKLTNTGAGNIRLTNNGLLDIAGIRNADGDVTVVNTGAINTSGLINVPNGAVDITANSPLRIGNDGISARGDVTLVATNRTSPGNIIIDGPIASGGMVTMKAGNNLTQNAAIFGADGVTATANGAFSYGPLAFTSRAPVSYSLNGIRVTPPINPLETRTRTNSPDAVVAFLDQFGRAQRRQIFDTVMTNPDGTPVRRRDRDAVLSELSEGVVCSR